MGRPHSGNARKKTFFCIDVFPYSLQCDFDCFVAPTFIQITIFSLRLRFQRAQCGETLIVGSSYTPLAETKTTFKYVLFYVPGYSKKSTTSFFQNHGRVIKSNPPHRQGYLRIQEKERMRVNVKAHITIAASMHVLAHRQGTCTDL